jgi:hypothetical protein
LKRVAKIEWLFVVVHFEYAGSMLVQGVGFLFVFLRDGKEGMRKWER